MMNYDISNVVEKYPSIHIGVLIGRDMNNQSQIPDLEELQKQAIDSAKELIGDKPPTKHPHISSWRETYRSFGTKPGDYRPSAEALIRRAIKEGNLPRINNAVDLYNLVSVKHVIPMGGFDLDKVDGNIHLRFSDGDEFFKPLGLGETEKTYPGEVVYADDSRILTRRWNYRDTDFTKITKQTKNLVMFIDATREISVEKVGKALLELQTLYEKNCGGTYNTDIANKDNQLINLEN
jgi:DNA/RNA-binding domain of Phe-tRNA-synthetase-like protein